MFENLSKEGPVGSQKILLFSIIAFSLIMRVVGAPLQLSPILSLALLLGAKGGKWQFNIPCLLGVMLLSDAVLGFHDLIFVVYGALAVIALGASWWLRSGKMESALAGSFFAAAFFFLVSNFAVWLTSGMYSMDWDGLLLCFGMGLPFFHRSFLSTVLYSFLFFGVWQIVQSKRTMLKSKALKN